MKTSILKTFCLATLMLAAQSVCGQRRAWQQTELKQWNFSKNKTEWQQVSIPHSCNAMDGHSQSYYRGKAYYKKQIEFSKSDLKKPAYILFEGAAQAATVSVNGKQVIEHRGGYTPFVVSLDKFIHEGKNEIEVCTDNTLDVSLIPVSSDFNKNNGLHNPVYLLKMNTVSFLPEKYGLYRMHVSTPFVSREKATGKVETSIVNTSGKKQKLKVVFTLKGKDAGSTAYRSEREIVMENGKSYDYLEQFEIKSPHLWNGLEDPYLYDAHISILDTKGKTMDEAETKVGFRFYQTTASEGFFLNGRSYPLRGVSEHQDWDGEASAVSKQHTYADYEIIKELGANFVRLAHYPHNDYEFRLCDSLGIVVQTEIPWVNVCGVKATPGYFENINQQMKEMIVNLYNHPSIIFWGMWNELSGWGNNDQLQGKIDNNKIVEESSKLYRYAKTLDPFRYVGVTDCSIYRDAEYTKLHCDFFSENRYPNWYQMGDMNRLTTEMNEVHRKMGVVSIAEYGGGANPFCHTLDSTVMKDRKDDSKHYEEYACYLHESDMKQILRMPWLNFTSLWIMFDFPVADRREGFMDSGDGVNFTPNENRKYMNDKGLVTRDRKIKKDHFYFYKALWNKKEPTVYITGRRRTGSPKEKAFNVKVYSNAKSLTLYQNGEKVQTLEKCPDYSGVIWMFNPVKYKTAKDKFKVVSDSGISDEVEWSAL